MIGCALLLLLFMLILMVTTGMIFKKNLFVDTGVILMFSSCRGHCTYCLASTNGWQGGEKIWVSLQCKHLLSINILIVSEFSILFFLKIFN